MKKRDVTPTVTVIVAVHDEEDVIVERLENLSAVDYPPDRLEIVVTSDGSTDRTEELVVEFARRVPRVRLVRCERAGKVAALNQAVSTTQGEILAFSDANSHWERDALAKLVRSFADDDVGYVCGQLRLDGSRGSNREGIYWQYELWLREQESRLWSITGGNGAIYAVRHEDYVEVPASAGHDFALPYLLAQRGRRSVYEPDAVAHERQTPEAEDEYARKVRMISQSWQHVATGRMLRDVPPVYVVELVSHRLLRYSIGLLHVGLLASTIPLAGRGGAYRIALAAQLGWLSLAAAGRRRMKVPGAGIAYYYLLVTWSTLPALAAYLRGRSPAMWEKVPGAR